MSLVDTFPLTQINERGWDPSYCEVAGVWFLPNTSQLPQFLFWFQGDSL